MNSAEKIVSLFGGQSKLAKLINKKQSTVAYWVKKGLIPVVWHQKLLNIGKSLSINLQAHDFLPSSTSSDTLKQHDGFENVTTYMSSPFAKWKGKIELAGTELDCYVLDNQQRVISLSATVKAIAEADSGDLVKFIGVSSLVNFINKEVILDGLIDFSIPGTQFKGKGLTTEHFELICRGYVQALYEDKDGSKLTPRQREIAIKCAVLTSGLTRTGLDALVDEATGYQYERAEDALQIKLRAFIAEELRAWEKTFPDELWEEFGRLTNWSTPLKNRPKWWGKLVIELIYDTLDPDVAIYLKDNRPPEGVHWHRQLSEDLGVRQLVSRCYEVIGMAKTCNNIHELRQKVSEHYGKKKLQLTLFI